MGSSQRTAIDMFLVILFAGFALFSTLFFAVFLRETIRGFSSYSWSRAQGNVIEITAAGDGRGRTLTYSYAVDGTTYRNDKISYSGDVARDERVLAPLTEGSDVAVFYHPSHPERSVLRRGIDPLLLFWVLFPLLVTIVLGSFAVALVTTARGDETTTQAAIRVFITTWLGLFTLIPSIFAAVLIHRAIQGIRSTTWPTVQGTIVSSDVIESKTLEARTVESVSLVREWRSSFATQITYTYIVDGTTYYGSRLDYGVPLLPTRATIKEREMKYRPGGAATIHYHPTDPTEAVLEVGTGIYLYGYLGLSFICMALFGIPLFRNIRQLLS